MESLSETEKIVCDKTGFIISNIKLDLESKDYFGSTYKINNKNVISRKSKITPKKLGQFVTFWKRNKEGITEPFTNTDVFDYLVINVENNGRIGQFIFPKNILEAKGVISTSQKGGKRGFRVYPSWTKPTSKQAVKTQDWQLNYFIEINNSTDSVILKNYYM